MGDLSVDRWANVIVSGLAFLACAAFVVVYHWKAPWWRSDVGRNLMALPSAIGVLCLYTVLITVWPEGRPAAVLRSVRTAVVLAIAVLMVQRTWMVWRAQSEPHDRTGV
ncbi:hypothetical protein [Streptomyces sp. DH37]|uniref:putative phage holin n=1 Tax=Streptomyces sp. DH37 TaxID=3040122 RepID=UPI0024429786|nr:hypothetical protein [Streptomyces sp. DH37]MDG9701649.1 hypothetical protein [Streptomyces sp. DH37]